MSDSEDYSEKLILDHEYFDFMPPFDFDNQSFDTLSTKAPNKVPATALLLRDIEKEIIEVIDECRGKISLGKLAKTYKKIHGKDLDYQILGFTKIKFLIEQLTNICIEPGNSGGILKKKKSQECTNSNSQNTKDSIKPVQFLLYPLPRLPRCYTKPKIISRRGKGYDIRRERAIARRAERFRAEAAIERAIHAEHTRATLKIQNAWRAYRPPQQSVSTENIEVDSDIDSDIFLTNMIISDRKWSLRVFLRFLIDCEQSILSIKKTIRLLNPKFTDSFIENYFISRYPDYWFYHKDLKTIYGFFSHWDRELFRTKLVTKDVLCDNIINHIIKYFD
tara:strand:- start:2350 stop:3351 length:1002 start_codon:yes stop_codon:yes gene_type:complete